MTEKQKYFRLLSMVCEVLPTTAVDGAIRAGYPLGSVALQQVRVGRTINLPALMAMVAVALPDFQIPAELLPAPTPQPPVFVMEDRAPYYTSASAGPRVPRNLAQPLAAWLRGYGFTTSEQALPLLTVLTAQWLSPRGERFELTYTWQAGCCPDATLQLRVLSPDLRIDVLCSAQRVRRLKEARLLLTNCVRLGNARLLATLPHPAL